VEGAIEAAAPEIVRIDVDTGEQTPTASGPVIAVDALWSHVDQAPPQGHAPALDLGHGSTWQAIAGLADLPDGEVAGFLVGQAPLIGCRVGSDFYAFLDRCGRCSAGLAGASLGRLLGGAAGDAALRCATCGAHFAVRRAGACLEQPELHLDPLPLLVSQGVATVALPSEAAA
jgi:nitrite reductase/ring-hydroxylating ferredoxin subunit